MVLEFRFIFFYTTCVLTFTKLGKGTLLHSVLKSLIAFELDLKMNDENAADAYSKIKKATDLLGSERA